jgi:hypothetical protein
MNHAILVAEVNRRQFTEKFLTKSSTVSDAFGGCSILDNLEKFCFSALLTSVVTEGLGDK